MVKKLRLKIKLVMCPIVREIDGLAMSSRNVHLSSIERQQALALNNALNQAKINFSSMSINKIEAEAVNFLKSSKGIDLEYFEICNGRNLHPAASKQATSLIALVAARVGNTRLIDNIILQ